MSEQQGGLHKVPLTKILEIQEHGNADALEIAIIYGFEVVVRKGTYKAGDMVVYIPIDSILPQDLEDALFGPDAKIKLDKHRVRQIKIRKRYSQGMVFSPYDPDLKHLVPKNMVAEQDYAQVFGITKYQPAQGKNSHLNAPRQPKEYHNDSFTKYKGLDNFKWFPELFKEGEEVQVEEKIHGSNIRCGWAPAVPRSFWDKVKKFFGFFPTHEWVYGSHNVQLQNPRNGLYGDDNYGRVLELFKLHEKLLPGEFIYGEIYGPGIQKHYHYGLEEGMHGLVIFDVKVTDGQGVSTYLEPLMRSGFLYERGLDHLEVPILFTGSYSKYKPERYVQGASVLSPKQSVREGIVIRSLEGRKLLKMINPKYLDDKSNTDYH